MHLQQVPLHVFLKQLTSTFLWSAISSWLHVCLIWILKSYLQSIVKICHGDEYYSSHHHAWMFSIACYKSYFSQNLSKEILWPVSSVITGFKVEINSGLLAGLIKLHFVGEKNVQEFDQDGGEVGSRVHLLQQKHWKYIYKGTVHTLQLWSNERRCQMSEKDKKMST